MRIVLVGAAALWLVVAAQANIVVTEIWPGGIAGAETTSDWFELTNYGAADVAVSGWYYDDNSNDPTSSDPIEGLTSIAAGESVILLASWEDDYAIVADAIASFEASWDVANALDNVQIGWVAGGGGLGGGGDAVHVYDGNTAGANTIATQTYIGPTAPASFVTAPDGTWNNELAQVGLWGAYASALPASDAPGIGPAIGSPGRVPEPASLALLSLGAVAALRRR